MARRLSRTKVGLTTRPSGTKRSRAIQREEATQPPVLKHFLTTRTAPPTQRMEVSLSLATRSANPTRRVAGNRYIATQLPVKAPPSAIKRFIRTLDLARLTLQPDFCPAPKTRRSARTRSTTIHTASATSRSAWGHSLATKTVSSTPLWVVTLCLVTYRASETWLLVIRRSSAIR